MTGMICIKLYGDVNFDFEEEKIIAFLETQGYRNQKNMVALSKKGYRKYDIMSYGDDQ
jgi:hypothetical protein